MIRLSTDVRFILQFVKINLLGISKIIKKYKKKFPHSSFDYFADKSVISSEYHIYKTLEIDQELKFIYSQAQNHHSDPFKTKVSDHSSTLTDLELASFLETIYEQETMKTDLLALVEKFESAVHRIVVGNILENNDDHYIQGNVHKHIDDPEVKEVDEISSANLINMRLSTFHPLVYLCAYTMTNSIATNYMDKLGIKSSLTGPILELSSIFSVFGGLYFGLLSNTNFKQGYVYCNLVCVIGYVFFATAYLFDSLALRATAIVLCRVLIGFGNAKAVSRRYVLHFAPTSKIAMYSFEFSAMMALGAFLGPLSNYLIAFLIDNNDYRQSIFDLNKYNVLGYTAALMMIGHTAALYILFKEPYDDDFNILKNQPLIEKYEDTEFLQNTEVLLKTVDQDQSSQIEKQVVIKEQDPSFLRTLILISYFLLVQRAMQETVLNGIWYFNKHVLEEETVTQYYLSLIVAFVSLGGFFFLLGVNKVNKLFHERTLLLIMFVIGLVGTFFCINLINNIFYYLVGYILIFNSGIALESILSSLFSKNLPENYSHGTFNAGFWVLLLTSIGKFAGGSASFWDEFINNPSRTITWIYSVSLSVLSISLGVLIFYYQDMINKLNK